MGKDGDGDGTTYAARNNKSGSPHELKGGAMYKNASRVSIVADEDDDNHGDLRVILFLDGHVEKKKNSESDFQSVTQPLSY